MSSSLILIILLWLTVIGGLILFQQNPIRRTSKGVTQTRLLHKGGQALKSTRMRPFFSKDDLEFDESAYDDLDYDEFAPEFDELNEDYDHYEQGELFAEDESVVAQAVYDEAIDAEVDADSTLEAESDEHDLDSDETIVDVEIIDEDSESEHDSEDHAELDEDSSATEDAEKVVAFSSAPSSVSVNVEDDELNEHGFVDVPNYYYRGGDMHPEVDSYDEVDEYEPVDEHEEEYSDYEDSAETQVEYAASRKGRGFYDPEVSHAVAAARLKKRKRTLLIMVAITVIALIVGIFVQGPAWVFFGLSLGLTGLYLFSLHRQAVEEQELAQLRAQRMHRARYGVRNASDDDLGIPDRLNKPGAVILETDDQDPELIGLDYMDYDQDYDDYADTFEQDQKNRAI